MLKSKRMRWVRHVACMGEINEYKIFIRKPEGKRSKDLGTGRRIKLE
jgi:hypothetical protein